MGAAGSKYEANMRSGDPSTIVITVMVIVIIVLVIVAGVEGGKAASAGSSPSFPTIAKVGLPAAGSQAAALTIADTNPATVAFTGVVSGGGSSISIPQTQTRGPGLATQVLASGLAPGTAYTATLQGVDASGKATNNQPVTFEFTTLAAGAPGPVQNLTVTDITASSTNVPKGWSSVMVSFQPAETDKGCNFIITTIGVACMTPVIALSPESLASSTGVYSTPIMVPNGIPIAFAVVAEDSTLGKTPECGTSSSCLRAQGPVTITDAVVYGAAAPLPMSKTCAYV